VNTTKLRIWVLAVLGPAACTPDAETGECGVNDPCERGSVCDLDNAVCMEVGAPTDATEDPTPMSFDDKVVPFFRGEVCAVTEAQAGSPFPVQLTPCLHPCLTVRGHQYKHSWVCVGDECAAMAVMWMSVDSADEGCPEDAFGKFDESLCTTPVTANLALTATYEDDKPVVGTMSFEVPFLSNADAELIDESDDDLETILEQIQKYPQDPGRMLPEPGVNLSLDNPAPPSDCNDDGGPCECVKIGF